MAGVPLYLREQGSKLGRSGQRLTLTKQGEKIFDIPIHRIERVIVMGHIHLSADAVALLLGKSIPVFFQTSYGRHCGVLLPPDSPHVELRKKQYKKLEDQDWCDNFCRKIITDKASNMVAVLKRHAYRQFSNPEIHKHCERIQEYLKKLLTYSGADSFRGIEGIISREYFAGLGLILQPRGIPFTGRNRRPPADPFNAALSFCYTLLTNQCSAALQTTGLDIFAGIMHIPHHGGEALVYDFVEKFRQPVADRFVLAQFLRKELTDNSFEPGSNGGFFLKDEPKKRFLAAWEEHLGTARKYGETSADANHLLLDNAAAWRQSMDMLRQVP